MLKIVLVIILLLPLIVLRVVNIDFDNILSDKKSPENFLIYKISYEKFIVAKPLPVRLDKANSIIKVFDGTRYLELFGSRIYTSSYDTHRISS